MMWNSPVYDRTLSDVLLKKRKGYINTRDLNRIESNMQHLAQTTGCEIETKEWQDGEFIFLSHLKRIKNNLQILTDVCKLTSASPNIPEIPFAVYSQWNDIEKIIFDMHSLFYANIKAVSFCGESYTGSQIGVI